jgi:hypothetical protein
MSTVLELVGGKATVIVDGMEWTDSALDDLLMDIALGDVEDKARATYTRCAPEWWHGRVVDLNADGGDDLLDLVSQ